MILHLHKTYERNYEMRIAVILFLLLLHESPHRVVSGAPATILQTVQGKSSAFAETVNADGSRQGECAYSDSNGNYMRIRFSFEAGGINPRYTLVEGESDLTMTETYTLCREYNDKLNTPVNIPPIQAPPIPIIPQDPLNIVFLTVPTYTTAGEVFNHAGGGASSLDSQLNHLHEVMRHHHMVQQQIFERQQQLLQQQNRALQHHFNDDLGLGRGFIH